MSPMAAAMLSPQPIVLPNPAVGSALFYLRRRRSCLSAVLSIHGHDTSSFFSGAILSTRKVASSYKLPGVAPAGVLQTENSSDSNHRDPPVVDSVTDHIVPAVVDGGSASGAALAPVRMRSRLRVAYQGVPGAYSEAAAREAYPYCQAIPFNQYEAGLQAVEMSMADRAVLSLESCVGDSIDENYDLLLPHCLHIVGEIFLPLHFCLLALPGVHKETLTQVMSHQRALNQCEHTLRRLGLRHMPMDDTAGAAMYVANNGLRDTAAIASARAAQLYGLQVLFDGIQDSNDNMTRFVMLAQEPIMPCTDQPLMTSIVFADNCESVLEGVLSAFVFHNIKLHRIVRRPADHLCPIDLGERILYNIRDIFYIDFQGSPWEPKAQKALNEIEKFTFFFRVLGSYPMGHKPPR